MLVWHLCRAIILADSVSRTWKKRLILATALLIMLAGAAVGPHLYLKHQVAAFRAELKRQGEKMSVADYVSPPPSDQPNGGVILSTVGSRLPKQFLGKSGIAIMRQISPGKMHVLWRYPFTINNSSSNNWPVIVQKLDNFAFDLAEARKGAECPVIYFPLDYQKSLTTFPSHLDALSEVIQWM